MVMKWYERFKDAAYSRYIEGGEAKRVHIVRDMAKNVDTSGNWIDILQTGIVEDGIHWVAVELFPRITIPEYLEDDWQYNRYICWCAAHEDIAKHRNKNHHGKKYMVLWIEEKIYGRFPNIEGKIPYTTIKFHAAKHIHDKDLHDPEACAKRMLK